VDQIIEKIRKLQALAERAGTEAEAANAAERVRELLLKHNLEIGSIALEQEKGSDESTDDDLCRVQGHHLDIAFACDELFDVKNYMVSRRVAYRRRLVRFHFVGLSANVKAACLTFSYLCASVESLLAGWKRDFDGEFWERASAYRSFRIGVTRRIKEMASEHKRQSQEHNPATAEIVRVANALAWRMYSGIKFSGRTRGGFAWPSDQGAYASGYAEGGRIDIHGARRNRMLS